MKVDLTPKSLLLFLILGEKPPVKVARRGRLSIPEAIERSLASVIERSEQTVFSVSTVNAMMPEVVFWITWHELQAVVEEQSRRVLSRDPSVQQSIERLANAVSQAIEWHS